MSNISNSLAPISEGPTITIGEILVEIMATTKGYGFLQAQPLIGPFPSGAPAIFIDQVGKLGEAAGIIAAVGNDDFGHLNINRLKQDGVDVSAIHVHEKFPTGYAFVRYQESGDRDFVFSIAESAAGQAGHLHIMGTALTLPGAWPIAKEALERVKARGGSVSFDPNMRKELGLSDELRARIDFLLQHTDLFLPSGAELSLLGDGETDAVVQDWLAGTNRELVLKRGEKGAVCYKDGSIFERPGIPTIEVDPTGAGDCFGATYLTSRRLGHSPEESLDFANAAGSLAVSKQGPMEGNSTFSELQKRLDENLAS